MNSSNNHDVIIVWILPKRGFIVTTCLTRTRTCTCSHMRLHLHTRTNVPNCNYALPQCCVTLISWGRYWRYWLPVCIHPYLFSPIGDCAHRSLTDHIVRSSDRQFHWLRGCHPVRLSSRPNNSVPVHMTFWLCWTGPMRDNCLPYWCERVIINLSLSIQFLTD